MNLKERNDQYMAKGGWMEEREGRNYRIAL